MLDILVIGDSFCADRSEDFHWPFAFSKSLTSDYKLRGKGFCGCSWWTVRTELLKELEKSVPNILILVHTEAQRLPNNYELGINSRSAETKVVSVNNLDYSYIQTDNYKNLLKPYYEHLHCIEFFDWAQHAWFEELDNMLLALSIDCIIHLHAFNNINIRCKTENGRYLFKSGITIEEPLWLFTTDPYNGEHPNHLSKDLNIKLGYALAEIVGNENLNQNNTYIIKDKLC
jgi:hypothetical protein